ncbi:helix-turn-helix domain-containing protein [Nocardioides sp.]|uniref:helix-turn-helix domain-containing protein n=1 Tax=Nocardioides sp. TaxID=35761 RepID=UPI0035298C7A
MSGPVLSEPIEADGEAPAAPVVEVRRRGALLGAIGVSAAAVAAAYLGRALTSASTLDWLLTIVLAGLALLFLGGLLDSRAPLVVADADGVRIRRGRRWAGSPWSEVSAAELHPRSGLRDGLIRLVDAGGREARVPLGLGTRVVGDGDPVAALAALAVAAPAYSPAAEPEAATNAPPPSAPHWRDPRPVLASGISALADRLPGRAGLGAVARLGRGRPHLPHGPGDASVDGALALDALGAEDTVAIVLPEDAELRRGDGALLDPGAASAGARTDDEELTEAIVWPVADPVLGPQLLQARRRLALTLDELATRTRIPARVLEAVERDDFRACGGDFYARGHLRTLARVLGLDAAPLVAGYDELYADRPVVIGAPSVARPAALPDRDPVPPRGSPRWSVLVAAVMAVVLAWSVARLVIESPMPQQRVAGLGAGSGGVHGAGASGKAVPVLLRAAGGGAHVVVRDGNGRIAFTGDLAFGESRRLDVVPPLRLDSSDGGVEVVVNGEEQGRLGELGHSASATYDGG